MDSFHVVLRFLMYLCAHSLLPVAVSDDIAECSTDSTDFDDDIFTITCPAGCSPYQNSAPVWGTGVYRSDSSICRAAIHDGRITDDGGQVTVYRWPGQGSYQGSRQNGIWTWTHRYSRDSSFAFTLVCRDALGMEDGPIQDGDITASSNQESWPPSAARLNGGRAWFPSDSEPFAGSWIQVDMGQQKTVSGVITQGYDGNLDYWVRQYQMRYLNNDGMWTGVTSPTGDVMNFPGNTGPNGQKTNIFYRPIVTQKIQLYPTSWQIEPGLRMELLGCDFIPASTTQPTDIRTMFTTLPTTIRTIFTTYPTTIMMTTTTQPTTAITTSTTQPTATKKTSTTQPTAIRTTSSNQRVTVMKTKPTASPRKTTTYNSDQTVGPFPSVTLLTLPTEAVFNGDHEGQKGARGSLGVGTIAGIAAGVAVVLIALLAFVTIFLRKRQPNKKGTSNVPRNAPEQRFRNPEYSGAAVANEHTASAQEEGYTDCELYNNTEDNNPYETYNYANPGQISGEEISEPHDYDYVTIPGESDRGVVDNVIYESSDMT